MEQVLDFLFTRPVLTIRQLETELGVTFPVARRYIEKLAQAGILREITGHARNRIFRAEEIYKALTGMDE
jgi:ribosomal protein S25